MAVENEVELSTDSADSEEEPVIEEVNMQYEKE